MLAHGVARLGLAVCLGRSRCGSGATACSSCAAPKGTNGLISPTRRSPQPLPNGLRRCSRTRRRSPISAPTNSTRALHNLLPWKLRRRLDAEAPTHFVAPSGSAVPIDYAAEEGPKICDPGAGTVRSRSSSGDRRRTGAAGGRTAVAGAPAGAGDARSAGLLARQLCGREGRDEGPLSAPSLAGRSAGGAADAPRQAARHNNSNLAISFTARSPIGVESRRPDARVSALLEPRVV